MGWRGALVAVLAWLVHLPALAQIGSVDSLEGDVRIVSRGSERAAAPGAQINQGDLVRTGDNAWVLLAMTDGTSLTVRPASQLRFDRYYYEPGGNPSQNSMFVTLLLGAFRSITGYIGRGNNSAYRVTTETATIGIRGTDHEPAFYPQGSAGQDPGTYDKVNQGETYIRNQRGEISVRPGQYGFVHRDARLAPRLLARPPAFYARHAVVDQRATARRAQFHRQFEQQHQQRLRERQQRSQQRDAGKERREALKQQREAVKQQREAAKDQRKEALKQRQLEREKKKRDEPAKHR